jgi:hypothetical protein
MHKVYLSVIAVLIAGMLVIAGYVFYLEAKRHPVIEPRKCGITIPALTPEGWCQGWDENRNVVHKKRGIRCYIN